MARQAVELLTREQLVYRSVSGLRTVGQIVNHIACGRAGWLLSIGEWVLWRIMAHDLHHGGEIALMLGEQGFAIPELGMQGGHITMPSLMEES